MAQLGEFEQLVLFALVRLGDDAWAIDIREEIESRADRAVSAGALYTTLGRLEERGLVRSEIGASSPERGGRRRKTYRLEPDGAQLLHASYTTVRRMATGLVPKLAALADGDEKRGR